MSEAQDKNYWLTRLPEKNWSTIKHPHRKIIIEALSRFKFKNLLEVGCGIGTNLSLIGQDQVFKNIKDSDLTGIDINDLFIYKAKELLPKVNFHVADIYKLPFADKSFDIILSDAVLLYVPPKDIMGVISELKRVAKQGIILLEWHDSSTLGVIKSSHWARDYSKLFNGFEVNKVKITKEIWPDINWEMLGMLYIVHLQ